MHHRKAVILDLLDRAHPAGLTGREIWEKSDGQVGRASVYVWLDVLLDEGLTREKNEVGKGPLTRTRHFITDAGRRALAAEQAPHHTPATA